MAKTILKGAGKLLGIGGKKKPAETVVAAEQTGPIIKPLNSSPVLTGPTRRRGQRGSLGETILSEKLGN